jgi:probable addiction module antidote protein
VELKPFDVSEYIHTPEAEAELLSDAFASGDARYIAHALGIVARARGISRVAREAGVSRVALHKAFSGDGDPKLSTLLGVMKALDMQLAAVPPSRDG